MLRVPGAAQLFLMTLNSRTHAGLWSVLLAALVGGCARQTESAKTAGQAVPAQARELLKVAFQLDWYPAPEHGGEYQALVGNYYRDAGLDVTIRSGGPMDLGLQKVATGRVQFSMAALDDVIHAVKEGLPLLVVGAHMQHNPQAIMVHEESPVRSLRDLAGKNVTCVVSSTWIYYLQNHYGISFNVVPADYGVARFLADRNYIQQCFITNEPYFAEQNGAKVRTFLIADAGYDPYRVLFTSKAFARDHPEAVRAFVACTTRGWADFLFGDASKARARIQADNPSQTPALMDYSVAMMKKYRIIDGDSAKGDRIGLITPERIRAVGQALVDLKILDAQPPLENYVSFDYLPAELKAAASPSLSPTPAT
jgi:NitT/TauT family transport system substrate-binding protein